MQGLENGSARKGEGFLFFVGRNSKMSRIHLMDQSTVSYTNLVEGLLFYDYGDDDDNDDDDDDDDDDGCCGKCC